MKKLPALLALVFGTTAIHATTIIDDFTTTTNPNTFAVGGSGCGGATNVSSVSGTNTGTNQIGGRSIDVNWIEGGGCATLDTTPSTLDFATDIDLGNLVNSEGTSANAVIRWTPNNLPANLSAETVLSFVMLYNHGTKFANGVPVAGDASTITWFLCTDGDANTNGTHCISRSMSLTSSAGGLFNLDFAGFSGSIDLSQVRQIRLVMTMQDSADITLDQIQATTPEPASLALVGSALIGLALIKRRK